MHNTNRFCLASVLPLMILVLTSCGGGAGDLTPQNKVQQGVIAPSTDIDVAGDIEKLTIVEETIDISKIPGADGPDNIEKSPDAEESSRSENSSGFLETSDSFESSVTEELPQDEARPGIEEPPEPDELAEFAELEELPDVEEPSDLAQASDIKNASSCPLNVVNNWVYESMQDYYLFYDQVDSNADISQYASPEELMRALRVQPNDKYSYVTDAITYNAFFNEGETFGYGWNFARDSDKRLLFSLIEPNSPLANAGVKRGDQLIAINGIDTEAFAQLPTTDRAGIIGTADEIKTLELTILRNDEPERQITVTKSTFTLKTVLDTKIIEHRDIKVGYLHFYQFVNTSSQELLQAFSQLNAAGVSELVLDLRFNGGGRISIANQLASQIIGETHTEDVFTTFAHNQKYQAKNVSVYFQAIPDSLSLNRVFVLQSTNTCSASELVVNSLRPFIEVITVGSTSCGKPYATSPNTACGKIANALEIKLLNADGTGDYFDGIAADCPVSDNVRYSLGDSTEPLLATALSYIGTGSCALLASRSKPVLHTLTTDYKSAWQGGNLR